MLYNPAMLRKMEFVDIGRCNARQKFSPFFFCHFFAKMAKTILFLWPDFALTADAPSLYPCPPPPSIEKQVKKSTKEIKKGFIVKFK